MTKSLHTYRVSTSDGQWIQVLATNPGRAIEAFRKNCFSAMSSEQFRSKHSPRVTRVRTEDAKP